MIGLELKRLERELDDTETAPLTLREPIARIPIGRFTYPLTPFGSDGAFALYDYHPLISFAAPARLRESGPPVPRYASPEGLPAPKKGLGKYMRNLSNRAYGMIRRAVGHVADYAVPERLSATNAYGAPEIGTVKNVPLPLGGIRAEQFTGRGSINLEPNTIPGTYENKTLGRVYRSALNFVRKRHGYFGEMGKRIERFYERTIENLKKEPLADLVHEYVHQMLEKLGINLEGNKNEAATTYITSRIMGKCSSTPETGYYILEKMGKYIFEKVLGMRSPEYALIGAENNPRVCRRIEGGFNNYWKEAYRKVGMR